jgi:xanthine dehydrogenase YagS FAD-binding subunit
MKAFVYRAPSTEEEAVQMLGPGAVALGGGTNLLNLMKDRIVEPDAVVDLRRIKGSDAIEVTADGAKIGANATLTSLLEHEGLVKGYPGLAQALESVATLQIRNAATLGGNLCARPPCWYFTSEGYSCPKRGSGQTCAAKEGDHEHHAIFATQGPCVAVHASSAAPALIALDAKIRIAGPKGAREIALEQFFVLPEKSVERENVLAAGEFVTHVMLPRAAPHSATCIALHKAAHDWPAGIASVALSIDGGTCKAARVCLGAVAPVPWRAARAEAALVGKKIDAAAAQSAADAAVADAQPLAQNKYKVKVAHTAVRRAALMAAAGKWR